MSFSLICAIISRFQLDILLCMFLVCLLLATCKGEGGVQFAPRLETHAPRKRQWREPTNNTANSRERSEEREEDGAGHTHRHTHSHDFMPARADPQGELEEGETREKEKRKRRADGPRVLDARYVRSSMFVQHGLLVLVVRGALSRSRVRGVPVGVMTPLLFVSELSPGNLRLPAASCPRAWAPVCRSGRGTRTAYA